MSTPASSPSPADISKTDGSEGTETQDRKAEHLQLAGQREMQARQNYFHGYAFEHRALPEIDLAEVDTSVSFLGKRLEAPLLISCMTGGTGKAESVNRNLARAAERAGIAVGVGSQRAALEKPKQQHTFQVRSEAPSVPLLGNLGAVQFNYGYGLAECESAVQMINADALAFHLNPLQEAIQPEGDRDFSTLLPKMGEVADQLSVPVIAKEIGCGISGSMARELVDHGIDMIDTAGQGGTSWARIEAQRADDVELGDLFADWGIPTPLAIQQVSEVPGTTVIGSGGVRSGVDVAKAIALGADLVGMASPFLKVAMESEEAVMSKIERTVRELRIAMFCVGARSISELQHVRIFERTR